MCVAGEPIYKIGNKVFNSDNNYIDYIQQYLCEQNQVNEGFKLDLITETNKLEFLGYKNDEQTRQKYPMNRIGVKIKR